MLRTDSELLVNGNCSAVNFLNYIEPYVGWNKKGILDICDSNGHVKGLAHLGNESALEMFTERETYVAVTMEKFEHGLDSCPDIFPTLLLSENDKMYPVLTENLQNRRKPQLGQPSAFRGSVVAGAGVHRGKNRGNMPSTISVSKTSTTKASSPGRGGRR